MTNTITPSVGGIVHYQAHGSPNGQHKSEARCALITGLHWDPGESAGTQPLNKDTVDLCVLNPTGLFFNVGCQYDADGGPGTWRWPPKVSP